jgi:Tfp pilus assembly protein FimT
MTRPERSTYRSAVGASVLEILFALSAGATAAAIAIPAIGGAVDDMRTVMAARYVAGRIRATRMDAVRRSRAVALRFERRDADGGEPLDRYTFGVFGDGNGNGVRTLDIRSGTDQALTAEECLRDRYPGVGFGLDVDVPDVDGRLGTGEDGVRIGTTQILTMSSDGTATSGTLYIRGRRGQYAVRVLGATGRTRMLQYHPGTRTWIDR